MLRVSQLGKRYRANGKEFWALRGVDLEVDLGDRLGITGPNGSGKSTLLKLLARVTRPSEGKIVLGGRTSALLEVGTGFHHELTGRENIFLSGAILGMAKREVRRHFDAIVAFSEIEPFLDIPAKRFSSGMFLRLAFSIMAHLQSEILIIDEILAMGDAAFQERCLDKMFELSDRGRAIIFVSHDRAKIDRLCNRVVAMNRGRLDVGQMALQ